VFWGAVGELPILVQGGTPFVVAAPLQGPLEAPSEGHLARMTTFVAVLLHFEWGTSLSVGLQVLHCCSVQVEVAQGRICRRTTCLLSAVPLLLRHKIRRQICSFNFSLLLILKFCWSAHRNIPRAI